MTTTTTTRPDEPPQQPTATRLWQRPSAWVVALLTLALCVALAANVTPLLRGPAPYPVEWQWELVWPPDLRPAWLVLPLAAAGLIGGWAAITHRAARMRWWMLFGLAGLALAFRLAVQMTGQDGLSIVARTLNPAYFGYFLPATEVDHLGAFLRTFVEQQGEFTIRVQTHPPGNVVFYWLFVRLFEALPGLTQWAAPLIEPQIALRPDWVAHYSVAHVLAGIAAALAVPGISTLGVLPLYRLGERLGGVRAARLAVVLYAFVPALVLFTPVVDDLFTFITVTALAWLVRGLDDDRRTWLVLAGLVWGAGAFMTFGLLPVMVLMELTVLLQRAGQRRWLDAVLDGLALAAGGIAVWGLVWLAVGLNPLAVYRASTGAHAGLTETRSYWLWLVYNPYDVLLFAGVPVAFHSARGAIRTLAQAARRAPLALADRLLLAFLLTMGILLLSGSVRGETARILLYVVPVLVWAAARDMALKEQTSPLYGPFMAALLAAQSIWFYTILDVYH